MKATVHLALAFSLALAAMSCDDAPRKSAVGPPQDTPLEPTKSAEPTKPTGPPDLAIDSISPKVGFERQSFNFPDGRKKLAEALGANKHHFEGKEVVLIVDRKAKQDWVSAYLAELHTINVPRVKVRTETRDEFPPALVFTPEAALSASPPCSTVAMVLADRGTAVWKRGGGVAGKRGKGMAGPDLSMTGETIERVSKPCKQGSVLFVAGAPEIEWGLVYDLAASTQQLKDAHFEAIGLLGKTPVPGHRVELGK